MSTDDKKITRRKFIKHSTLGTVGVVAGVSTLPACHTIRDNMRMLSNTFLGTEDPVPDDTQPIQPIVSSIFSEVSVIESPVAVHEDGTKDREIIQAMFDRAIFNYTGKESVEEAWKEIIPELKPTDKIGIKINCISPAMPSSPEVVDAVIHHLLAVGIQENNIIVWDRCETGRIMGMGNLVKSGYTLNNSDTGVRYVGTGGEGYGYDDDTRVQVPSEDLTFPVSTILSRECDYLINVPQLRHHAKSGVSLCMKNYYGAIALFDTFSAVKSSQMHRNNCNPAIPELYNNDIFKKKTRLHVCDVLMTMFENGPIGPPQCVPGRMMVGTDPVALDYLGLMIIENERQKRGIGTLMKRAKYIQTAAELGIGTNNPEQISIIKEHVS